MIESAARPREGMWASIVGIVVLLIATTGVFGEVQSAMNAIWKARPSHHSTLTRLVRARAASLGLVMTAGFRLTVSLATGAGLAAVAGVLRNIFPAAQVMLHMVVVVSQGAPLAVLVACGA